MSVTIQQQLYTPYTFMFLTPDATTKVYLFSGSLYPSSSPVLPSVQCTVQYSAVQSVQYSTVPLVDWRIGGWHSQRERWSQMDRHSNIYTTLGILTGIPTFLNWGNIGGHLCCINGHIGTELRGQHMSCFAMPCVDC